jgi:hypothetical protein
MCMYWVYLEDNHFFFLYQNVYIQCSKKTKTKKYSKTHLNRTSLGPACVFRIDRCSGLVWFMVLNATFNNISVIL